MDDERMMNGWYLVTNGEQWWVMVSNGELFMVNNGVFHGWWMVNNHQSPGEWWIILNNDDNDCSWWIKGWRMDDEWMIFHE